MKPPRAISRTLCALLVCCFLPCSAVHGQQDVVTIGFVGDFSDASKSYTENMYDAFEMAIDEINAAGGVCGKSVRILCEDGSNDPQRHRELVENLTEEQHVAAVFGGASSPCVLEASEICRQRQIPYLVSIGNSQSIVAEHGHPYVVLLEPSSWMESKGFSIFLTLMPWKRYAWVGPDYTWGHEVLGNFKHHFGEIGASVEWTTEAWHQVGTTDFSAIINQVMQGNPEALVIGSWGEDARLFALEAKQHSLFDKMAVYAWFTYEVNGEMGNWLPQGTWILSRGPFNHLAEKNPLARRFVDAFVERYQSYPNGFTVCCYDSVLAWRQAVEKAGSTEPVAVANALRGLEFDSLRGRRRIRAVDGQMDCPAYFGRLGKVPEYPYPVLQSVMEIPAAKTWLSEQEVLERRGRSG